MSRFRPYKALASINSASPSAAHAMFAACSASAAWARRMANARPFAMLEDLYRAAEIAWVQESFTDLDAYASVERELDAMLENLGRTETSAETGAEARA